MEQLLSWDLAVFRAVNGAHSPWLDLVMYTLSLRTVWIPLYLLLAYLLWRRLGWRHTLAVLALAGVAILLSDQTTSGLLKPWVARYRPCRPEAMLPFAVHLVYDKCGGPYGFASSHAANFFALAALLSRVFVRRGMAVALFAAATLVAYSRVYLGVHYPGDVLAGALVGLAAGGATGRLWHRYAVPRL
ncbi:MAG: hypothetical protein OHK0039_18070 [Bacteroidia bacterium]